MLRPPPLTTFPRLIVKSFHFPAKAFAGEDLVRDVFILDLVWRTLLKTENNLEFSRETRWTKSVCILTIIQDDNYTYKLVA